MHDHVSYIVRRDIIHEAGGNILNCKRGVSLGWVWLTFGEWVYLDSAHMVLFPYLLAARITIKQTPAQYSCTHYFALLDSTVKSHPRCKQCPTRTASISAHTHTFVILLWTPSQVHAASYYYRV